MTALSRCAEIVRANDPDRFLTVLFAPEPKREALWTLFAFNHEIARAREIVREPMMALIRLQWWREVAEGARRRHEVAEPLGAMIDSGAIRPADLEEMIAGREAEASGLDDLADWEKFLWRAHGAVQQAAGRVLGADEDAAGVLARYGAAYGGAGALRRVTPLARRGRCQLPDEALRRHGLTAEAVIAEPARGAPVVQDLAASLRPLCRRGRVPRAGVAAALPLVLARRDLRRLDQPPGPRGLGDRVAVALAAFRGHV